MVLQRFIWQQHSQFNFFDLLSDETVNRVGLPYLLRLQFLNSGLPLGPIALYYLVKNLQALQHKAFLLGNSSKPVCFVLH